MIFILPALLGTIIFIIIPVICSFGLSFAKWDLLTPIQYVGLSNYTDLFKEDLFWKILCNTVVFALSVSVLGVIIPLVLASILNNKIRGSEFFKSAYFLPFITPMVVVGIVWAWIFDPNIGLLNQILHIHINWLYDSKFAMPALIRVFRQFRRAYLKPQKLTELIHSKLLKMLLFLYYHPQYFLL